MLFGYGVPPKVPDLALKVEREGASRKHRKVERVGIDPLVVEAARNRLIAVARDKTLITYTELAADIDYSMGNGLGPLLEVVSQDCRARQEWSLAALVVRKDTGVPGDGWTEGAVPWSDEVHALYDHWG